MGAEELGKGCLKITLIVSCLEWLTCLLLFIIVEFEKVLYSPDLKTVLIFLVTRVFQAVPKGYNVQMSLCFTQTSGAMSRKSATMFCGTAPPPSGKIAFDSPVKIAFRRFLFADDTNLFFSHIYFPD